jgi:hypothetical protein
MEIDDQLRGSLLREFVPQLRFDIPLRSYLSASRAPNARFLVDPQRRWVAVRALPNPSWSLYAPISFPFGELAGEVVQAVLATDANMKCLRFAGEDSDHQCRRVTTILQQSNRKLKGR